jgi:hypothetical protein
MADFAGRIHEATRASFALADFISARNSTGIYFRLIDDAFDLFRQVFID